LLVFDQLIDQPLSTQKETIVPRCTDTQTHTC
jgi:hypothetical protein